MNGLAVSKCPAHLGQRHERNDHQTSQLKIAAATLEREHIFAPSARAN